MVLLRFVARSLMPSWEEVLLFNDIFSYFLSRQESDPKVVMFFEVRLNLRSKIQPVFPITFTCTVPVKCKLTVTRNSNDSTRTSILETRKLRVSSLESSLSSFESSRSSFESG